MKNKQIKCSTVGKVKYIAVISVNTLQPLEIMGIFHYKISFSILLTKIVRKNLITLKDMLSDMISRVCFKALPEKQQYGDR